ncbi:MAG TPA: NADAR family protein, partial [Pyrinomonadaceae bacterium]|nr:NADAR family protein [Pyrinomonadaceae bacterium]
PNQSNENAADAETPRTQRKTKISNLVLGYSVRTISILILGLLWATCSAQTTDRAPIKRDPRYPAHWWTPISDPSKPDWEILPQEAGSGEVILSKRHELGLLSNFAPTPFTYRGKRYGSLEGFWQMMLYPEGPKDPRAQTPRIVWKYTRDQVAQMTAFEAKSAGTLAEQNMEQISIDWVTFEGKRFKYRSMKPGEHYRLIVEATREKVKQNPEVRRVLLATGNLILKPDHHGESNAPPEWRYYEILMMIRKELQNQR